MGGNTVSLGNAVSNLFAVFGLAAGPSFAALERLAANVWLWIVVAGYAISFAGMTLLVYIMMRLYDLRQREKAYYETLIGAPVAAAGPSPRWQRIRELGGSTNASEWREAIIEADVLLDEALGRRGYAGQGVGEKLMQIPREGFAHLSDAWEAHKVRNQIAHEGSAFDLSAVLVARTLARFESALRELGAL
ncbi:MAG: hypothetical protein KGI78_01875 [Patescibacteria group bacterium]|nr:hypothetical protein [Patescibacteria group bacterium]MDE1944193.1 hypothetical protein [Patescibacteria group bacterium]MDE1945306.1 hypothetical protein [Patescibacteria group bacterium]MDE2057584.1 hypothetical protein [Patescibacteria group bacterium]